MECVQDVQNLSQREKNSILHVLQRDEKLRQGQEQKIEKLRQEISVIRMCSVLRAGDIQDKLCLRCRQEFGVIFNRGAICPACHFKVCKQCQEMMFNGSWLCRLCYKQRQLKWLSGEWAASFEQNPLRKWASGSDLVKSSLTMVPGSTSIDIDDEPSEQGQSETNNKGRKLSRNGVPSHEGDRSRVEVPREEDQHKLSELFNVLRVTRPGQEKVQRQETQVRRVTSRRYSESDSDSSSNSEDVDVRSSSTGVSVTESERDGRRVESPRSIESPVESQILDMTDSYEAKRRDLQTHEVEKETRVNRPVPSPRSPKPNARTFEHVDVKEKSPRPSPRNHRRPADKTDSRAVSSRSEKTLPNSGEMKNSDSTILSAHVAKTKQSLEIKHEVEKSKSQNSLSTLPPESIQNELVVRPKVKDYDKLRKSAESLIRDNENYQKDTRKSDGHLEKKSHQTVAISPKITQQHEKTSRDSGNQNISTIYDTDTNIVIAVNDTPKSNVVMDELTIDPRAGSPYSFSMDSLPSSHPSPTLRSTSFTSQPESSDNDSVMVHSEPAVDRYSAETGVKGQAGTDEEFDVEEISKVRFRRMSKGTLGQQAVIAAMNKSPKKNESGDDVIEQEETQNRGNYGKFEEREGILQGKTVGGVGDKIQVKLRAQHVEKEIAQEVKAQSKNSQKGGQIANKPQRHTSAGEGNGEEFEDVMVKVEKSHNLSATNDIGELLARKLNAISSQRSSLIASETGSPADGNRYHGQPRDVSNESLSVQSLKSKKPPKHLMSSVTSDSIKFPSEADSIEGLVDDMYRESTKGLKSFDNNVTSSVRSMTPITPVNVDLYGANSADYKLAYMSDDNLDAEVFEEGADDSKLYPQKKLLQAMGSLDRLLSDQGDLVDESLTEIELEREFQNALRYSNEDDPEIIEILGSFEPQSNSSEIHDTSAKVSEVKTEKKHDKDEILKVQSTTSSIKIKEQDFETSLEVREPAISSSIKKGHLETEPKELPVKQKLAAKSSLDVLVESQGSLIDRNTKSVEFDAEFLASLEKQFQESIQQQQSKGFGGENELKYLGMSHKITDIKAVPRDEVDSGIVKHDEDFNQLVDSAESFLKGNAEALAKKEDHSGDDQKPCLQDVKAHVSRLGIPVQDHISETSSDSDMLSVIEEVDNEESDTESHTDPQERRRSSLKENRRFSKEPTTNEAEKCKEIFQEDSPLTKPEHEKKPKMHGKIFEKVKDFEKNEIESKTGYGIARKIKQKAADSKTVNKYKKLHDMWHAVEKNEGNILEFDDDDDDDEDDDDEVDGCNDNVVVDASYMDQSVEKQPLTKIIIQSEIQSDSKSPTESSEVDANEHVIESDDVIIDLNSQDKSYLCGSINDSSTFCHSIKSNPNNTQSLSDEHSNETETSFPELDSDNALKPQQKDSYLCESINERSQLCCTIPTDNSLAVNSSSYLCASIHESSHRCHSISPEDSIDHTSEAFMLSDSDERTKSSHTITFKKPAMSDEGDIDTVLTLAKLQMESKADQSQEQHLTVSSLSDNSYLCGSINESSEYCHSIASEKGTLEPAGNQEPIDEDIIMSKHVERKSYAGPIPDINIIQSSIVRKKRPGEKQIGSENDEMTVRKDLCHSICDFEDEVVSEAASIVQSRKKHSITVFRGRCNSISDDDVEDEEFSKNLQELIRSHDYLSPCRSIPDGDSKLYYNVPEDSETCHSIDESLIQRPLVETIEEGEEEEEVEDNIVSEDNTLVQAHKPLRRLAGEKGKVGVIEKQDTFSSQVNIVLESSDKGTVPASAKTEAQIFLKTADVPQHPSSSSSADVIVEDVVKMTSIEETFKEPPVRPPRTKKTSLSSLNPPKTPDSTPSSLPFGDMDSPRSEKLVLSRVESPQTISECSSIQDDSGHVSGGSRGTTPEHKRTDSSFSQSSIPSTVTDDTDEDIDQIVAKVKQKKMLGSRGNLLSVFGDSRESIASYYSDAGDIAYSNVPVTGEILFSLNYNYKTSMLEVGIKNCRDIAMADTRRNRSDPYVKTYLLPDRTRGGKRKTKVKKHTTNPTFDETLKYELTKSELENRTLWVTVWHNDRFGRNVFLGEVTINFDYHKFEDPFPRWYPLQERMDAQPSSMMVYKGDISICIRFVPPDKVTTSTGKGKKETGRGQLQVMVKEARNLTGVKSNGFSDPFCKGYLLPERHKTSKQKTAVVKKDCNPVWNHTFIFEDVTLMELRERCLELTIWDYEKLTSNDFLGGVRLNLGTGSSQGKTVDWMDARGEEMSMWQAMLDRSNFWIDGALILRPNMEKRKF